MERRGICHKRFIEGFDDVHVLDDSFFFHLYGGWDLRASGYFGVLCTLYIISNYPKYK